MIVSTPQDIALKDAVKGIQMFRKVDVPVCHARSLLDWEVPGLRPYFPDSRHDPEHVCLRLSALPSKHAYLRSRGGASSLCQT